MKKNIGSIRSLSVLLFCCVFAIGLGACAKGLTDPDDLENNTEAAGNSDSDKGGTGVDPNVQITGDGTKANPFTVTDVIALNNTKTGNFWVQGVIVGQIKAGKTTWRNNTEFQPPFTADGAGVGTNILMAVKAGETTNIIAAQLAKDTKVQEAVRNGVNLPQNGGNLSKTILLYGTLGKYMYLPGVKKVTYAEIDGNTYGTEPK